MTKTFAPHFDDMHAVTCKVVQQIPEAQRDFRPVPEMMKAFDLAFHMFSQEKVMLVGCRTGKLEMQEFEKVQADTASLRTMADVARYGEEVHRETSQWLASVSAEELAKPVEAFFGPATREQMLSFAFEHIVHHRGQLYVYLRHMGIEPVFVFSGDSVEEFRKKLA